MVKDKNITFKAFRNSQCLSSLFADKSGRELERVYDNVYDYAARLAVKEEEERLLSAFEQEHGRKPENLEEIRLLRPLLRETDSYDLVKQRHLYKAAYDYKEDPDCIVIWDAGWSF